CVVAVVATEKRRKDRPCPALEKKMKRSVKSVLKWAPAAVPGAMSTTSVDMLFPGFFMVYAGCHAQTLLQQRMGMLTRVSTSHAHPPPRRSSEHGTHRKSEIMAPTENPKSACFPGSNSRTP
ncbi:MAG: hypothetical protein JW818_23455, partial [Pirellulales bacterium]|nr:hypothetical protein [Pirellulales bacterium]